MDFLQCDKRRFGSHKSQNEYTNTKEQTSPSGPTVSRRRTPEPVTSHFPSGSRRRANLQSQTKHLSFPPFPGPSEQEWGWKGVSVCNPVPAQIVRDVEMPGRVFSARRCRCLVVIFAPGTKRTDKPTTGIAAALCNMCVNVGMPNPDTP